MAGTEPSKFTFTVEGNLRRSRLDDTVLERLGAFLKEEPGEVSRTKVRRMIIDGTVSINGRPVYTSTLTVKPGDRISVFLDRERFFREKRPDDIEFELDEKRILFEDDWLIALDKPAGIPTEATIVASRDSLHAAVLRFLSARGAADQEPYAGLHHRLDRETSGVILFAKKRDANAALHAAFEHHEVIKTYDALSGPAARGADAEFRVSGMMGRISAKSARAKWGTVSSGGLRAETDFRILARYAEGTRVQAMPRTGRTHQIRVHLAACGMPILGDALYGGDTEPGGEPARRVMLHAAKLELRHPASGEPLCLKAPLPPDFEVCLAALGKKRA